VFYYCRTYYKAVRVGGGLCDFVSHGCWDSEDSGGYVLRETTPSPKKKKCNVRGPPYWRPAKGVTRGQCPRRFVTLDGYHNRPTPASAACGCAAFAPEQFAPLSCFGSCKPSACFAACGGAAIAHDARRARGAPPPGAGASCRLVLVSNWCSHRCVGVQPHRGEDTQN